jgi:hypothetical protein
VARLIALVLLRWRTDLRGFGSGRERGLGLLLAVPGLLLFSVVGSFVVFFGVRAVAGADPGALLPLMSLAATGIGLTWCLSPLLTGLALSETHDPTRLLHFPIPLPTLVASSLLANLAQPLVLSEIPIMAALTLALGERLFLLPFAAAGVALAFATLLAVAQAVGLAFHGLSRNRRWRDVALFLGVGLGFAMGLLPLLLLSGGSGPLRGLLRLLLRSDLLAVSPFAWGVRAAVHGGRGELTAFAAWAGAATVAIGAAMAVSSLLLERVYRGALDVGGGRARSAGRPRMVFASPLGALVEKDIRAAWRDPAFRASLLMGLAGPLLFLLLLWQARGSLGQGGALLTLALVVGAAGFGANAFGMERRGVALLMGFPLERWRLLAAKNLGALLLRVPGLLVVLLGGLLVAPLDRLPAAATIAIVTFVIAAGADNFASILFPVAAPEPGKPVPAGLSGRRGLGAFALHGVLLGGALLLAAPFVFLAWLPPLLGRPSLWLATLPLALAGAGAAYAMLVAGAAHLLERREPEMLERILVES